MRAVGHNVYCYCGHALMHLITHCTDQDLGFPCAYELGFLLERSFSMQYVPFSLFP